MNDKKMAHWILICAALSFTATLAFGGFEDAQMREPQGETTGEAPGYEIPMECEEVIQQEKCE